MKKKTRSKLLAFGALFVVACSLSSCTKSFCTVRDNASTLWTLDKVEEGKKSFTENLNEQATKLGYLLPSDEFVTAWNEKIDTYAENLIKNDPSLKDKSEDYAKAIAKFGGNYEVGMHLSEIDYTKDKLWSNYDAWMEELTYEVGVEFAPDQNYIDYYKKTYNAQVKGKSTCISPNDIVIDGVQIEGKSWKEAFDYGLLEGLLVYPVSWLIYTFSVAFGLNGWGQLLAIFLVTLIVRAFLILCTFKPTLSQQKMTALQPEMAKIQAKYPNAATNPYEKQRLGQEQMELYKKNKVNPFSMIIVMLVQFPLFICVWSAMTGSAILADGDIFGLKLSSNTGAAIGKFNWVAIVLFVVMAITQFLAMKIPQWIQQKNTKNVAKLSKNPTEEKNLKTMNMVSYGMTIMIIIMGLQLPVAMTFYWIVTAIISLGQSLLNQYILGKHKDKNGKKNVKYKTKKQAK